MNVVPAASAAASAAVAASPIDNMITSINTSPYVSSSMMLLLNLGGRFLGLELTKGQEKFFTHPYVRRFLIFCIMFVATRNVLIALWMTALIVLIIGYVANENSALCIFGKGPVDGTACSKEGFTASQQSGLTQEEESILKVLSDKKARASIQAPTDNTDSGQKSIVDIYKKNISKLA